MNYNTINTDKITLFHTKCNFFQNYFFPFTITEWNKLDPNLRGATRLKAFKKNLLKFIRPFPNIVFNCHNGERIKYLKRLRLGLSHVREHTFEYSIQDTKNSFCSCDLDVERNTHFFSLLPLV